jgi:membrane protease YdiL (CAAX protease family)
MKNQVLSENEQVPDLKTGLLLVLIIISLSILISKIFGYLFPEAVLETKILFAGICTFLIESMILYYYFGNYRRYFSRILHGSASLFLRGFYFYLLAIPALIIIGSLSLKILKVLNIPSHPQQIFFLYLQTENLYITFILFFLSVFFAPFAEEVIFRGIFYKALKEKFSSKTSIILNAFIFALFHGEVVSFLGLFFLGILLAYLFEKYRNLWVPIGLHFFNNFFSCVIVILIKLNPLYRDLVFGI